MKRIYISLLAVILISKYSIAQIYTPGNGVTDSDGNTYATIIIGDHEWMAENLRTSHYANGDAILNSSSNSAWTGSFGNPDPAFCWYDNNSSYDATYGKLYNWYAVEDVRNVCPSGWYVPDWEEWSDLLLQIDPSGNIYGTQMSFSAGYKMKAVSFNGSNESGFNGVAAGGRGSSGIFDSLDEEAYWWSRADNEFDILFSNPMARWVYLSSQHLNRTSKSRKSGVSVRCVTIPGTGINDHSTIPIELFPNPATTEIRFNLPTSLVGTRFEIINVLGKVVHVGTIESTSTQLGIDWLTSGLHVLRIEGKETYLTKFLVQ